MCKIEIMKKCELSDLLSFLNLVFSGAENSNYFEKALPKAWIDDDEHMEKHLCIKENGKILAVLGIYPYEVYIGEQKFTFATVGNMAVSEEARGRGYMGKLYEMSDRILKEKNIDAARLGGLRSRYNRFGYEYGGNVYNATITRHNAENYLKKQGTKKYSFKKLDIADNEIIKKAREFYYKNVIRAERDNDKDFIDVLSAWSCTPYAALSENGDFAGYFTVYPNGVDIPEQNGVCETTTVEFICQYLLETNNRQVKLSVFPWQTKLCQLLSSFCEYFSSDYASQFKILNWEGIVEALLQAKANLTNLIDGQLTIGIEGYGNLEIKVENQIPSCKKRKITPDIKLDGLSATRFIFGHISPMMVSDVPSGKSAFVQSIFPLPLSWNNQDRL